MDQLKVECQSKPTRWRSKQKWALAGVVGSGNLEILLEPKATKKTVMIVLNTSVGGFEQVWRAVLRDFAREHRCGGTNVTINDMGAIPAVVKLLRLR